MVSYPVTCRYCHGFNHRFIPLNKTSKYSGAEIAVNSQGMLRVRVQNECDIFTTQEIVNIEYCPACGRRFRRTNDG